MMNLEAPHLTAIELKNVSKRYRRPNLAPLRTTLKSFLLRDLWRAPHPQGPKAQDNPVWALHEVSMRFLKGRATGVIGRNGAGKSTLLKLLGKILVPDAGTLLVRGRVAALIELGAGFHPELTGRENILINGVILGRSKAEMRAKTAEIIAFADIGDFIEYPVRTYSSGMYARLGFAVAIHTDPDILLVDEILSVGDAEFTRKCRGALDGFRQRGKSIVVVSHDLHTISAFCDDCIWLDKGHVVAAGPASEVIRAYDQATAEVP